MKQYTPTYMSEFSSGIWCVDQLIKEIIAICDTEFVFQYPVGACLVEMCGIKSN